MSLTDKLKRLDGIYPFHMPGHKRNTDLCGTDLPYALDITEITGFDNLHEPTGVIADIEKRLAAFYGAKQSFLLVNGSTCGIEAAILSVCGFGGKIIAARNCHKSVYKAIELYDLTSVWIMPEADPVTGICGAITEQSVSEALEDNPDASLVVITSPTYEGIISDVRRIAGICRRQGVLLLCDCAHGAHLPLLGEFSCDADITVFSLHKTLPCLTQTACACIDTDRVNTAAFRSVLGAFETSSPSYILMAGADECMSLIKSKGEKLAKKHSSRLSDFRANVSNMQHLRLFENRYLCSDVDKPRFDVWKICIDCSETNLTGSELFAILRDKYSLECEMFSARYVLAMTSLADTDEALQRLSDALCEIDGTLCSSAAEPFPALAAPCAAMTAYEAVRRPTEQTTALNAEGKISGGYVWTYPPGIPIIAPGEIITSEALNYLRFLADCGVTLHSSGELLTTIEE